MQELIAATRQQIVCLHNSMQKAIDEGLMPDCKPALKIRHFFIPGGYAREMTSPAGLIIVGKIHKHWCVNVISKGSILVATEQGNKSIVAPYTFISKPGTKRVGVTLEETVWTTFHVTAEMNVDKIEDALTVDTYEEFEQLETNRISLE